MFRASMGDAQGLGMALYLGSLWDANARTRVSGMQGGHLNLSSLFDPPTKHHS